MRRKGFILLLMFAAVIVTAHPTDLSDGSGSSALEFRLAFDEDIVDDIAKDAADDDVLQREEALIKLQQIFGISEPMDKPSPHKIPPQFMMELYNTIADPSGVTRGKNPYNAKIVRSFTERDSSVAHYYLFNISGLETNESVLEAELHLYRRRTPLKAMHPAVLSSPYYLIRVYQVLDEHQLDIPDLHRLLNVHYVGAHASGWQVFNVKQAVLSWMSGTPNLGLLVTASNLFGDSAPVRFTRRNDYRHSKQPILVLFDDDGKDTPVGENIIPHYYKYGNDLEEDEGDESAAYGDHKIERDDDSGSGGDKFEGPERTDNRTLPRDEGFRERERRQASNPKKKQLIVSKTRHMSEALTSMDVYERAMLRKKLTRRGKAAERSEPSSSEVRDSDPTTKRRRSRAVPETSTPKSSPTSESNATECTRHELYVDFAEIGWFDFIIAPKGYSAYHCKGHCNFPLSQGQRPTNHATVQSIVHMLRKGNDVNQPCCVPTKLLSISLLYFLDDSNVVLKLYQDMVADRCGCH